MDYDIATEPHARRNDAALAEKGQACVESGRQLRIGAVVIGMADARVLADAHLFVNYTALDDCARFDDCIIEDDTIPDERALAHLNARG